MYMYMHTYNIYIYTYIHSCICMYICTYSMLLNVTITKYIEGLYTTAPQNTVYN